MAKDKLYQSPELTLALFAEKVNIPSYYASQVINEKLDCNFFDFVNGYRIEAAMAMLVNPKYNHYTIVAIAFEAGFNSKSAFYSAFKKITNLTPSQFRKGKIMA